MDPEAWRHHTILTLKLQAHVTLSHWNSQKAVSPKNFTIFSGKYLCWGLFLIKLQAFRPATILKRDSKKEYCGYCEYFKSNFFIEHLRWLLLTVLLQYCKVSWGPCSLTLRLYMLSISVKNYTKRCTNNSLLSRDTTISSLIELIYHVLSISEYSSGCKMFWT